MLAIRAIEIQQYYTENNISEREFPQLKRLTIGVSIDRDLRRQKITKRLNERLQSGMLAEVEGLLEHVSAEDLMYYGLEYKYLTMCVIGQLSYQEMVRQ